MNASTRKAPSSGTSSSDGEPGEQRHVDRHQDAGAGIAQVTVGAVGEPPQDDGERGEQEADDEAGRPPRPGQRHHRHGAHEQRDQRGAEAAGLQGAGELHDRDEDRGGEDAEERGAPQEQGRHDDRDQADADGDGGPQVAPGATDRLLGHGELAVGGLHDRRRRDVVGVPDHGLGRRRWRGPRRRRSAPGRCRRGRRRRAAEPADRGPGPARPPIGGIGPVPLPEGRGWSAAGGGVMVGDGPSEVRPRAARSPCSSWPRRCRARAAR